MDTRRDNSSSGLGTPPARGRLRRFSGLQRTRIRFRARLRRRVLSLVTTWVALAGGITALPGSGDVAAAAPVAGTPRVWIDSATPSDSLPDADAHAAARSGTGHTLSVDVRAEPHDAAQSWVVPVGPVGGPPPVVRDFDPPDEPWLAGHRGVDLTGAPDGPVRATADGTVVHAGQVGGVGVVSISHGTVRSTYQPVAPTVRVGARVAAGEVIGALETEGGHCQPGACLHWGAVRGDTYVDPLQFLTSTDIRLLPLDDRAISEDPPPPSAQGLMWPVADPVVTSPFGTRVHPITGVRKLHDGTDFGTPCGTPIRAAAPGTVTAAGARGAYGLQVSLDHGVVAGIRTTTSSSHLSRIDVRPGERVSTGQIIGRAGTTGLSTGCHLHFMVYSDSGLVDPMTRLPGA